MEDNNCEYSYCFKELEPRILKALEHVFSSRNFFVRMVDKIFGEKYVYSNRFLFLNCNAFISNNILFNSQYPVVLLCGKKTKQLKLFGLFDLLPDLENHWKEKEDNA